MSQLITEKENERFAANTADMTQDDFFVIAILEMCTDPELSKKFREIKTDELTWEKLKDVAEVNERATASDNRVMLVNSNKKNWKNNQSTQSNASDATGRATRKENAEPTKRNSTANSARLKDMYPKPASKRSRGTTATKSLVTRIKRDR